MTRGHIAPPPHCLAMLVLCLLLFIFFDSSGWLQILFRERSVGDSKAKHTVTTSQFHRKYDKELSWVGGFFGFCQRSITILWSLNMISKFQLLWILRYLKETVITVESNWSYPYSSSSSWKLPSIIERERVQVISNQPKAWLADSDHKSHDHRPILRLQAHGF